QDKSSASNWSAAVPKQQHAGRVQLRMHVFLFRLLQHGVEDTAAECERLGASVQAFVVDCSKKEEIYSAAEKVKKDIGDVSILVNNAGVITAADLLSTQDHQIERMFEVNILAHIW
ncbi:PREDICTED: estradiol 17-beta-dehydrogenase 11-like, partial [Fulmarus glacialis]|uniref:estradiol 17-beta-dehydrogenase 11-like n=1 Tax=Fulmarus glacialis TaxID=30455 RepID=UPI00051BBFF3